MAARTRPLHRTVYAPNGQFKDSGGHHTFPSGAIYAQEVDLIGGHNTFGTAQ